MSAARSHRIRVGAEGGRRVLCVAAASLSASQTANLADSSIDPIRSSACGHAHHQRRPLSCRIQPLCLAYHKWLASQAAADASRPCCAYRTGRGALIPHKFTAPSFQRPCKPARLRTGAAPARTGARMEIPRIPGSACNFSVLTKVCDRATPQDSSLGLQPYWRDHALSG